MTTSEACKVLLFLNNYASWQVMILREFYWYGPPFVKQRYDLDIYNFLTNMGILEVE